MIHYLTPYRKDKDLGKAYNEAIRDTDCILGDWICLMDIDVMFLTPDGPAIIEKYIDDLKMNDVGMLTCYTNRVGSKEQLLAGKISGNTDILHHIRIAEQRKAHSTLTELKDDISG